MIKLASLTLCTALLAPSAALAAIQQLAGPIDVAQATTCVTSTAEGVVTATLDDVTGLFSWTVTFGNNAPDFNNGLLDGVEFAAHFHSAPPGTPGDIQTPPGVLAAGSPKVGSTTLDAAKMADVLNALWYINIHSIGPCSGGEIRGQLLVVTATPVLPTWGWVLFGVLALCGVGLLSRRAFLKS